jgi:hypothetical protein
VFIFALPLGGWLAERYRIVAPIGLANAWLGSLALIAVNRRPELDPPVASPAVVTEVCHFADGAGRPRKRIRAMEELPRRNGYTVPPFSSAGGN